MKSFLKVNVDLQTKNKHTDGYKLSYINVNQQVLFWYK